MSVPTLITSTTRAPVAVWEFGSGPAVLIVHGFPDHPVGFFDLAERLAEAGYRCVLPALPGWAPSGAAPGGDYSPQAVGRDLIAVLDELGIRRCAYIGHDWGAELGFPMVATNPERFTRMLSLAVPHPTGYRVRRSSFAELRSAWYAVYLAYATGAADIAREPGWLEALIESWSPDLRWARRDQVLTWVRKPGVLEAICAYYRSNLDSDLDPTVIPIATTIIHGEDDGCIGPAAYPDFSEYFPAGVETHVLAGCGHWPHLEASRETDEIILGALGRTEF